MLDARAHGAGGVHPLCVGGGLATVEDMWQVLRAGADKTSINSRAVQQPDLINQGQSASAASVLSCLSTLSGWSSWTAGGGGRST